MNSRRIKNVLLKEWTVLFKDNSTMTLVTVVPLLILGEATAVVWLIDKFGGAAILSNSFFQGVLDKFAASLPVAATLADVDLIRLFLLYQLNLYFLLIPTMIAVSTAANSIVEEKTSRSLEPLLATPVRTGELLLGKALAGAVPALVVSWACAGISLIVFNVMEWGYLSPYLLTANWYLNLFLLTPLIAILSFLLGVIGSARAKDARNAQTLSMFIILPVFALIAAQVTGVLWLSPLVTVILGVVIFFIDLAVMRLSVRLFQRESIIIKWK